MLLLFLSRSHSFDASATDYWHFLGDVLLSFFLLLLGLGFMAAKDTLSGSVLVLALQSNILLHRLSLSHLRLMSMPISVST